jgi:DUF177 domain-containing protein
LTQPGAVPILDCCAPGEHPAFFRSRCGIVAAANFENAADMDRDSSFEMDLHNETVINVAALLHDPLGSSRTFPLELERFILDEDLEARDFKGEVRLTRLTDEILATVKGTGRVELECQRCLEPFTQPVSVRFSEEFRIAYDVRTGTGLGVTTEEDEFEISAAHELDFGEPLRQEILIELPMRPSCGDRCPGPPAIASDDGDDQVDERFAALAALLNETGDDS